MADNSMLLVRLSNRSRLVNSLTFYGMGFFFALIALLFVNYIHGQSMPQFNVQNNELVQLANQMRQADENKAKPGQIVLNYQGHTNTRDNSDNAKSKLFSKVDSALLRKPTYTKFLALSNNFNRQTGIREPNVSQAEESREISDFLDAIFATKPWQKLYQYFNSKGHPFAKSPSEWKFWISQLWFVHYSRARGLADTSGFEHVFMGEAKNGEVSGMHNWVRFHQLENKPSEQFDYKGFIVKRFNLMAAVKYQWFSEMKRSGSFLIGTSVEFDMALYTMCFLTRRGRQTCDIEIDGCPLSITSYDLIQNNKVFIGSIFPSAGRITDQCRRANG